MLVGLIDGLVAIILVTVATNFMGTTELPPLFRDMAQLVGIGKVGGFDLWSLVVVLLGLMFREVVNGAAKSFMHLITPGLVTNIRERILENLFSANFAFLDRFESDVFRHVVTNEVGNTIKTAQSLAILASISFSIIAMVALMIYLSATLAALMAGFAIILVPLRFLYSKWLHRRESRSLTEMFRLHEILNEITQNIRQIKLLGRLRDFNALARGASYRTAWLRAHVVLLKTWDPLALYVSALGVVLAMLLLNRWVGLVDAELLIGFLLLIYRTLSPATGFSSALNDVIVNEPHVIATYGFYFPGPENLERPDGREISKQTIDLVRFDDVGLTYANGTRALEHIELEVHRGELIAIVGPSGAGKSSLLHLLLGMYRRSSGNITLEGPGISADLDEISLSSLRSMIGFVTQDIGLFNTSVRDLIRGGDGSLSDDDTVAAARRADAEEFILGFPRGYDTVVGERGILLSGGQRQRLVIAQILARTTPIIVLDEATNALDMISERKVHETLTGLKTGHIVIVVTHRVSTLEGFDRIYVMDGGRIHEFGDWDTLMANRGLFQELVRGEAAETGDRVRSA